MEIEGFNDIIGIITLAKELHDINRFDIVKDQFCETLCCDSWIEDMYGTVSSVFTGFYSNYDDGNESEIMIFTDDIISDYFTYAWVFGKKTGTPYDKNPFVSEAVQAVRRWFSFCYAMDWKLLGYTKTKKTARQSKLILYVGTCDCDCHNHLAYNLVQLYKWFADKVAEFKKPKEVVAA